MVWTAIFGAISFELYGHLYGSVDAGREHRDAFFESCIAVWTAQLGIT